MNARQWRPRLPEHLYCLFIFHLQKVGYLTLVMLNKLRCNAHFQLPANQINWFRFLIEIHIFNDKQCRSRSVGFRQLIWSYTAKTGQVVFSKRRVKYPLSKSIWRTADRSADLVLCFLHYLTQINLVQIISIYNLQIIVSRENSLIIGFPALWRRVCICWCWFDCQPHITNILLKWPILLLTMVSWSVQPNQLFGLSQWCNYTSLVRIC